jgi:hypothetical protein
MLHHDIKPIPNGNLLAIAWELKTPEEARAAGRREDLIPKRGLWSEWILEIAPFVSGANRLPNGHTFIRAGTHGRYFEVTQEGNVVWEYKSLFHEELFGWNPPGVENFPYASFRAIKFPPDHPAFSGRALAPLDPQPPGYVLPPRAPKPAN